MNKTNKIISGIVVLLIVGGGAFYGGMLYGKSHPVIQPGAPLNNGARLSRNFGAGAGGLTMGSVIAKDASSITLQLPNNTGSKIIFYSDATQITKTASGTPDDLTNGTTVSVTGTTNSDGSITAQSIQIRPANKINN